MKNGTAGAEFETYSEVYKWSRDKESSVIPGERSGSSNE